MSSPRPHPEDRRSGFALLITITLLVFLVLLLVSLAALTRVETQVASNNRQLSQARQNALMALNIAFGKLQAAAGPDQRVTATAELVDNAEPANRHWTGVWDSDPASATYGQRLIWLVSGATPDVAAAVLDPITNPTDSVRLVGENTTDVGTTALSERNRVDVPLEEILATTVPGIAAAPAGHVVGRFGYWVGDEGVKAKVSLADPWAGTTDEEEKTYRLKSAQRVGIELVDSAAGVPLAANYPANAVKLPKVLDLRQLPLTNTTGGAALDAAIQKRYHDLTASSWSVLADVAQGGLKKDLTSWLARPALASGAPTDDQPIFPRHKDDADGFDLPRWGIIRSYAGLEGASDPLDPQKQTTRRQGFHPVVTYARVGFSAHAGEPDEAGLSKLVAQVFPVIVLWNPYTAPIKQHTYEFVIGARSANAFVRFKAESKTGYLSLCTFSPQLSLSTPPWSNGENPKRKFLRFLVESPDLAPGESLVFTLKASGDYVVPGTSVAEGESGPIPLVPNNPAAPDNSLFISTADAVLPAGDRAAGKKIQVRTMNNPWIQFGLFEPSGADATVADAVADGAYMLTGWIRTAGRGDAPVEILTAPQMPTAPIRNVYVRMQMSRYDTSYWAGTPYHINIRWLAQLNPRAPYHLFVPPGTSPGGSITMVGDIPDNTAVPNDKFDGNKASAGPWIIADGTSTNPVIPLQISELVPASGKPGARFFSLAQLQHANFSLLGQTAGSAVGNSQVNFLVGRTRTGVSGKPESFGANLQEQPPASQVTWFNDMSYRLNEALWDRYFFSTVPDTLTDTPAGGQVNDPAFRLPNARHVIFKNDGQALGAADLAGPNAFNTAAAHLLVNGAFNVNSTSEQAWRALLASHNGVDAAGDAGFTHPYSRFSFTEPGDPAADAPKPNTSWTSGYRILSNDQITLLAEKIVAEVKARGPFLSLADFVNRRLADDATGLKGPLQAAIDATDLDDKPDNRINDRAPFNDAAYAVEEDAMHPSKTTQSVAKQNFLADADAQVGRPSTSRAAFAPGFLTQADLLNSLGPVLTARSDTFVIRAYGEVQNPTTATIEGKAWCEAIVQRLPEYVESGLDPWTTPNAGSESQTFGRRFKMISFRWLSPNDI